MERLSRVCVVGAGNTGSSLVLALADGRVAGAVDVYSREPCQASAAILDAASAYPLAAELLRPVDEVKGCYDAVVITAGLQPSPELGGPALLLENHRIAVEAARDIDGDRPLVIVIGTPVDQLAMLVAESLPHCTVLGFGGELDRARLGYYLGLRGSIPDWYTIVGEHGARAIPVYPGEHGYDEVRDQTTSVLKQIKQATGPARNLATGPQLARLLAALAGQESELCISARHPELGSWVTWPWVVGKDRALRPSRVELGPRAATALNHLISERAQEDAEALDSCRNRV